MEITSVAANLAYVVLIAKRSIWGWPVGIVGAATGAYLFVSGHLYFDGFLYGTYAVMCALGWWRWHSTKNSDTERVVSRMKRNQLLGLICLGFIVAALLGWFAEKYTDQDFPFLDAGTTVFGLLFTWMQAERKVENWLGWIATNFVAASVYYQKGYMFYVGLMIVLNGLAVVGFLEWRRAMIRCAR